MKQTTKRIFILHWNGRTEYYTTIAGIFDKHTEQEIGCTIKDLYPVPTGKNPYHGVKCAIHVAELNINVHK